MLSCALLCGSFSAQSGWAADLSRLVVVGDSISAGVENFSLEQDQQIHGYASVIATQAATQANVQLTLPLVPFPGAPNTLQLTSLNPITVTQVSGSLPPIPRVNPCDQPTNVSVPGVTLDQALTMVPTANTSGSPVQDWANIVLGFPNPFGIGAGLCAGPVSAPQTEVQQAVALKPTAIITWLGNNDVLVPAMIGALNMLTPLNTFTISYGKLLDTLGQTKAPILTATIPDVTKVPFFTPLTVLAARVNLSVNTVADKLGLDSNDLLRPTAVPIATAILQGQQQGPLPTTCPAPVALQALTPNVPCVLKAGDAAYIRGTVGIFNVIIFAQSLAHGATVVDIHGLVDKLAQNGYTTAAGKTLTTGFLGGLISLDGVHPTNTGYGIIANTFIDTMNRWWGTAIPHADIDKIAATDPLVAPFPPPPFTVNSSN